MRALAGRPSRSWRGWAQWKPERMAIPSPSRAVATSEAVSPSTVKGMQGTRRTRSAGPISRTWRIRDIPSTIRRNRTSSWARISGQPNADM